MRRGIDQRREWLFSSPIDGKCKICGEKSSLANKSYCEECRKKQNKLKLERYYNKKRKAGNNNK